jgi:hypothetical protein
VPHFHIFFNKEVGHLLKKVWLENENAYTCHVRYLNPDKPNYGEDIKNLIEYFCKETEQSKVPKNF